MHPGEHEQMARVEDRHWWYRGLRDVVARCLGQPDLALPPEPRVLDAGCGSGANLVMLSELLHPAYLGGFDLSPEAVEMARRRAPAADVYPGDVCDPAIHVDELDLLISLDVICIPGAERSREGLRRLAARLRPGGLLILNLPAYDWLYSEHDVAVHTSERFTRRRVDELLRGLGLRVERSSYRVCALFPAVLLGRLPGMLSARRGDPDARSDLHREPGPATSRLLFRVLQTENAWIARGGRLPWGSSVFAVGRKA